MKHRDSFSQALRKHRVVVFAAALWLPATGVGIRALLRYSSTPGVPAAPLPALPADSAIRRVPGHSTLLVFAHPQCACSRATIGELALIRAQSPEPVEISVFFYVPPAEPGAWAHSDLWQSAAAIPGVRTVEDYNGVTARRLGAFTSGQVLLYDPSGRLVFSGGVTSSRGHAGDNAGRDAVVALLRGRAAPRNRTAVFGCSIHGES